MTKARIYTMAMYELIRRYKKEQTQKAGKIKTAKLKKLDEEIKELHEMILDAEKNNY